MCQQWGFCSRNPKVVPKAPFLCNAGFEYEGWKAHSVCRVRACRGWPGRGLRLVRDLPGDAEPVGAGEVGTLCPNGDVVTARAGGWKQLPIW